MNVSSNETLYYSVTKFNESVNTVCYDAPPHIVSDGLWGGKKNGRTPMRSFLPMFELEMLVIFAVTQICYLLLKPLGLPMFISQMLAGIIISSSVHLDPLGKYTKMLLPYGTHDVISTISSIGYVLFIFINGVQMDFSMITRTGKRAWTIALFGIVVPLVIGHSALLILTDQLDIAFGAKAKDIFVAMVSHTVTSFAVIACLLNELQIQNSELGRLALSSALVTDILTTIMTSIVTVAASLPTINEIVVNLLSFVAFAIIVPLVSRPAMFWIIKHTPEGRPVKNGYIYIIIIMVLVLGWVSVQIKQDFILGAFVLGLSVPEGPPLGSALVKKFQFFGTSLLLPIFVATSVMRADFFMAYKSDIIILTVGIVLLTHFVKIIACFLPALYCNMPTNDALSLALILNSKGVVEIGLYCTLYDSKIINGQTYGVLMISVMVIASIVQLSVKILYDPSRKYAGYQRRNIMSLKPNSELRILACIHKPNQITPITDVLNLCCPTEENPIIVDALHLVELVGRVLPIFIPHGLQRQSSGSQRSFSDDVILAFDIYEHDNLDTATVHTYTAISPPNLMYEDVCHLALDKVASIIILPFHQRWSSDGTIESDDKNIKALNCKVLEIAPCSVGILVSRAANSIRESSSSSTRLALVYIGGKDDREALCLAKRAIRNPNINLVVYHLVLNVKDYAPDMEHDALEDNAALRDIDIGLENVTYQEIVANDGPQTATFLRDIINEHDFFVVGRRHGMDSPQTEGLSDWSEFPELGAIGDFLASPDFKTHASVLVVQQQVSKAEAHSGWLL